MRALFFIAILLLLASCGLPFKDVKYSEEKRVFQTSDPTFAGQIARFEELGKQQTGDPNFTVGDIPINFHDTGNPEFRGLCVLYADGTKEIFIEKEWWSSTNDLYRESLLFHELGHCRLNRDHDDETFAIGNKTYKTSMMNHIIVAPSDYDRFKPEYLEELFTYNKNLLLNALGINANQ